MDGRLKKKWKKTMSGLEEGWRSYGLLREREEVRWEREREQRRAMKRT
jgi:hypothetical protein